MLGELGPSERWSLFVVAEDASGGSSSSIGAGYQYVGWVPVEAVAIGGGSSVPRERQG